MLASMDGVRPVFMIIMGLFLMVIAWRVAGKAAPWTARILIAGALLLGLGYSLILPLYEAGVLHAPRPDDSPNTVAWLLGWKAVKQVALNVGWMLFGFGICLHARVFSSLFHPNKVPQPYPPRECTPRLKC